MRETKASDYFLLTLLALIWASAFFNIKVATYSYGPLTIAFLRILFGAIPKPIHELEEIVFEDVTKG